MTDLNEYNSIGRVERETGISRDTLRVWERRYGHPQPLRSPAGERLYSPTDISLLQRVRRLLDQGHKPSKLLGLSANELERIEQVSHPGKVHKLQRAEVDALIDSAKSADVVTFQSLLNGYGQRYGMTQFIHELMSPLLIQVEQQWAQGQLQIHHEHFITQQLTQYIYTRLSKYALPEKPSVILATLPGEQHGLGLLMLMVLLAEQGHRSVNFGVEIPALQLIDAAHQYPVSCVGLTFSMAYPYKKIRSHVNELRSQLDSTISIWLGGEAVAPLRKLGPGVIKLPSFNNLPVSELGSLLS